ncbi:unnamed protein product [Phytophthora lilii]|uniref:Unnamed protein product n=1 Tax=Phytophthora lilii TaxID=2077276 RepID=A0A9W6TKV7_9STRA|nr:unnamed protein product [Phytophthora lilii]
MFVAWYAGDFPEPTVTTESASEFRGSVDRISCSRRASSLQRCSSSGRPSCLYWGSTCPSLSATCPLTFRSSMDFRLCGGCAGRLPRHHAHVVSGQHQGVHVLRVPGLCTTFHRSHHGAHAGAQTLPPERGGQRQRQQHQEHGEHQEPPQPPTHQDQRQRVGHDQPHRERHHHRRRSQVVPDQISRETSQHAHCPQRRHQRSRRKKRVAGRLGIDPARPNATVLEDPTAGRDGIWEHVLSIKGLGKESFERTTSSAMIASTSVASAWVSQSHRSNTRVPSASPRFVPSVS